MMTIASIINIPPNPILPKRSNSDFAALKIKLIPPIEMPNADKTIANIFPINPSIIASSSLCEIFEFCTGIFIAEYQLNVKHFKI